jgi:hypothetical protein
VVQVTEHLMSLLLCLLADDVVAQVTEHLMSLLLCLLSDDVVV